MSRNPRTPLTDSSPPVRITWRGLREGARIFAYLWPYRRKFAVAQFCLLVSSLGGLAFPYFTGRLIDGAFPGLAGAVASSGRPPASIGLNTTALLLMLVLAVQALCAFFQTYWLTEVGERSLADLRRDTYARLLHLPMAFFAGRRVGELASRLTADLSLIQHALTDSGPQLLRQLVMLVGGVLLISLTSSRLTLVMLCSVPVVIGLAAVFGRLTRQVSHEAQDRLADTNVVVEETLQGIASVKAFANEDYETSRYGAGIEKFIGAVLRGARYQGMFGAFLTFAGFGSIVLVIWYGARLVESGELTFGQLTRFMLYTMFISGAIGGFVRGYTQVQRTIGATQRVRELLQEEPEGLDCAVVEAVRPRDDGRLAGAITFEEVSFSYPSRKEVTVLRRLALTVEVGQRVALVGPSGAGKSTIGSLVLRFYDPDSGRVLVDGRDARDYSLRHLREQMAIVPQDVLLFGGTIADNIAYGRPGASPAEIEAAARRANAHGFISAFPDGYQTVVGERGVQLSGGQRQRVAIARAVLRDPAILILDEATSSLDSESESLVQQALEVLMQGRTSVIIAHRLSTVRQADRIYVIKEGEVAEVGTHAELVARPDGVYRMLSELQFDLGERDEIVG